MTFKKFISDNIVILIGSLLVMAVLCFRPTIVNGESMAPTLHDGDKLLLNTLDKTPEIGDIVVVDASDFINEKYIIKRVTDIQGDMIYIRGDNTGNTYDSDKFGYIPMDCVVGVVLFK